MQKRKIKVDDYTTPSPESVKPNDSLQKVWETMNQKGIRHALVRDEQNNIIGILSQRDITTFSQADNFNNITAEEVMSRDLFTAHPDTELYEVALKMSDKKIGSAVIEDPENSYTGIFTATDALNALVEVLRGDNDTN